MIVCRNTIKEMTVNSIQISGPVGGAEKQIPGLRNGRWSGTAWSGPSDCTGSSGIL